MTSESYLDRYLHGACVEVWAELQALGETVSEEPLYTDVYAVARETMRRARRNIEVLIPRLVHIGYQFGYGWLQPPPLSSFEVRERKWYTAALAWTRTQPPMFVSASASLEDLADAQARLTFARERKAPPIIVKHWEQRVAVLQAIPTAIEQLETFERRFGALPLSVRAWYEEVGAVNFVGSCHTWEQMLGQQTASSMQEDFEEDMHGYSHYPLTVLAPLAVYPLDFLQNAAEAPHGETYRLPLLPDSNSLYAEIPQPSPWSFNFPAQSVDAVLTSNRASQTFVEHLRRCFQFGGFPGWKAFDVRPEHELAGLSADLLPL